MPDLSEVTDVIQKLQTSIEQNNKLNQTIIANQQRVVQEHCIPQANGQVCPNAKIWAPDALDKQTLYNRRSTDIGNPDYNPPEPVTVPQERITGQTFTLKDLITLVVILVSGALAWNNLTHRLEDTEKELSRSEQAQQQHLIDNKEQFNRVETFNKQLRANQNEKISNLENKLDKLDDRIKELEHSSFLRDWGPTQKE